MRTVHTVFGMTMDVPDDEAAMLERQGLLRDEPVPQDVEDDMVTVVPSFTGKPMQMPRSEADQLRNDGLLIEDTSPNTEPTGDAEHKEGE